MNLGTVKRQKPEADISSVPKKQKLDAKTVGKYAKYAFLIWIHIYLAKWCCIIVKIL